MMMRRMQMTMYVVMVAKSRGGRWKCRELAREMTSRWRWWESVMRNGRRAFFRSRLHRTRRKSPIIRRLVLHWEIFVVRKSRRHPLALAVVVPHRDLVVVLLYISARVAPRVRRLHAGVACFGSGIFSVTAAPVVIFQGLCCFHGFSMHA